MRVPLAESMRVKSVLRFALSVLVYGGTLCAQQQVGSIMGQIRLQDGTFPTERLQVNLEAHGSVAGITFSDYEGKFVFGDLGANLYNVVIEVEGYQPVRLQVNVNPTITQVNMVHVVLRPKAEEKSRGAPDGRRGGNPDSVDVAELAKKFPAAG